MFTQRFDELFKAMGIASNSEFARYAGCDRSYISRIRSGGRILMPESRAAKRLIRSIYTCAAEKEVLGQVCALVECPAELSPYEIQNAISAWLFQGDSFSKRQAGARSYDKMHSGSFANRLNDVINLAELSNVRLARLANVDASVISRYRRGLRSPGANSYILESICRTLISRIVAQGSLDNLCELTGATSAMLSNDEIAVDVFRSWLCDSGADDTIIIESFLEGLDSFVPDSQARIPAVGDVVGSDVIADDSIIYYGPQGLQRATLKFLAKVISSGASELWLYTEQSFDWLRDDSEFSARWVALLSECVRAGIRIKIIHNIDKNLEEMVFSVENWLPFYVSGMIESYYSTKSAGERFVHTLFLAPNVACISSCYAANWENGARYRFHTDKENLDYFRELYENLQSDCRTLIKLERGARPINTQSKDVGGINVVQNTLTLGTMPEEVLNMILRRVQLPNGQEEELRQEWHQQREFYAANLNNAYIRECIPAFPAESVQGCRIPVDTSAALIMYTGEEFKKHVENIIGLLTDYPNYQLSLLEKMPFEHVKLTVSSKSATLRRTDIAANELCVTHPLMRLAFVSYAEQMEAQYDEERDGTSDKLREYLSL